MKITRRRFLALASLSSMGIAFRSARAREPGDTAKELKALRAELARYKEEAEDLLAGKPAGLTAQERQMRVAENQLIIANLEAEEKRCVARLARVDAGIDGTEGISNICPVHHRVMEARYVPVECHMMISPGDPPFQVSAREFPFADTYFEAGCVDWEETRAKVFVCPDCVRAKAVWVKGHGGKRG